jgi:poly-beta-1,6-N-acetyl-D-glucosamine synthase
VDNHPRYVIITPVRDEEKYIDQAINSIVSQTVLPDRWVIVNDGSTDRTGQLANAAAGQHSWISVIHRPNRGFRKAGGGVIDAFYDGYGAVQSNEWDFIVKLDGDLSFEPDYFDKCFREFKSNQKIGIGGGMIYHLVNGGLHWEPHPMFHVRGATKIYRRQCWDAIGGLIRAPGWDTLDEVKASMLGWETRTFPDLKIVHHRFTGKADGMWRTTVKNGLANYISGYHPLFMALKCFKRVIRPPYLVGSVGLIVGFLGGYVKRTPRVDDPALISYLRKEQMKRLLGKPSIWQ